MLFIFNYIKKSNKIVDFYIKKPPTGGPYYVLHTGNRLLPEGCCHLFTIKFALVIRDPDGGHTVPDEIGDGAGF